MQQFERDVLRRHPARQLDDDAFCRAIARIQGEFLAIHPFREGNARTIKLLTDLLALQTDRPLLRYDMCVLPEIPALFQTLIGSHNASVNRLRSHSQPPTRCPSREPVPGP